MMRQFQIALRMFLLVAVVVAITTSAHAAKANTTGDAKAKAFVEDLGDKAVAIVTASGATDASKRQGLMDLMKNSIDFDWVGKFVLGRHWRTATDEQKKRFIPLYREFLLKSYTSKVQEYTTVTFNITGTEKAGDKEYVVHTEIGKKNESPVKVDYRLLGESKFKIIDMVVEGVSLLTTQRSEFNSVITRDSRGVDNLNDLLEKRAKEL